MSEFGNATEAQYAQNETEPGVHVYYEGKFATAALADILSEPQPKTDGREEFIGRLASTDLLTYSA